MYNNYLLVAASLKVPLEGRHGPRIATAVAVSVHVCIEPITLKMKIVASAPNVVFSPCLKGGRPS